MLPEKPATDSHLSRLRKQAGLTVRELSRQLGTSHTNLMYWERTGKIAKTEFIIPISKALGVSVEEILGNPKPRKTTVARGRMAKLFAQASELPKRRQERISIVLEDMLAASEAKAS